MSEIRNLTRNGETFYPLTCTEGLVNRDGNVVGEINDIFDISEYNASGTPSVLAKYETLSLALAAVPEGKRKGGMTIRYVQSSDNKYVQYRLMAQSFTIDTSEWQEVKPVQQKGQSTTTAMSQKAVTDELNLIEETISEYSIIPTSEIILNNFLNSAGTLVSNNSFQVNKYPVEAGKAYYFTNSFLAGSTTYFVFWLDENGDLISYEPYKGLASEDVSYTDQIVYSPAGAAYCAMNLYKGRASKVFLKELSFINSRDLLKSVDHGNIFVCPGQIRRSDGRLNAGNDVYATPYLPITSSDDIEITGAWCTSNYGYAFYDENKIFISSGPDNMSADNYSIKILKENIPANARYFRCYANFLRNVEHNVKFGAISSLTKEIDIISLYKDDILQNRADLREKRIMAEIEYIDHSFVDNVGTIQSLEAFYILKFQVEGGKLYTFSGHFGNNTGVYFVYWFDSNNNYIGAQPQYSGQNGAVTYIDRAVLAPSNAAYAMLNCVHFTRVRYDYNFKLVTDNIIAQDLKEVLTEHNSELLTPYETLTNTFLKISESDGTLKYGESNFMGIRKYSGILANESYTFSARITEGFNYLVLTWIGSNGKSIKQEYVGASGQIDLWTNEEVVAPQGAVELWMNFQPNGASYFNFKHIAKELINVSELSNKVAQNTEDINSLKNSIGNNLMKVVINELEGAEDIMPFYIRTRYNANKDIIITHRINKNTLITFDSAYVGSKELTDDELMTSTYLVFSHADSTGPIRSFTPYWHLFAQHGYPVPYFANSVGMTSADVGALWKDQLNREFRIGKVTDSYIWLLPVIYQDANGHYTRDWHSTATSTTITNLTYVSGGGSGAYTSPITVSSISQEQLRPIMQHSERTWTVDGKKIIEAGTYYCDEFKVNESQVGYDPATIQDWFGGADGKPNLTGAEVMAKFTYSYNYKGAQCAVNTTLQILREVTGTYSGTQQQFFTDKGDYKAMFMIPKSKERNGIDYSKPFNSPSTSSPSVSFYRTSKHLVDVNDPVDRQIGFLYNPNTNDYLVGMAAGLSLVSGDTVKEKRNVNRPVNSILLNLSPSNNNKFYVYATDSDVYENDYYPVGYFKEINYYVSYFDPAENIGQVYWYKDGNSYVIYAHCQNELHNYSIKVPEFMEGLSLSVVEKTANAELLTETIQNGKFFVNYNTADANYIVLKAE